MFMSVHPQYSGCGGADNENERGGGKTAVEGSCVKTRDWNERVLPQSTGSFDFSIRF